MRISVLYQGYPETSHAQDTSRAKIKRTQFPLENSMSQTAKTVIEPFVQHYFHNVISSKKADIAQHMI